MKTGIHPKRLASSQKAERQRSYSVTARQRQPKRTDPSPAAIGLAALSEVSRALPRRPSNAALHISGRQIPMSLPVPQSKRERRSPRRWSDDSLTKRFYDCDGEFDRATQCQIPINMDKKKHVFTSTFTDSLRAPSWKHD